MDWREQKRLVAAALVQILPTLAHPHLAVPLGFLVAKATGIEEKRCRAVMGWLAKDGHAHATHDGGKVTSYGRDVERWRWHSTPQRASNTAARVATVFDYETMPLDALEAEMTRLAELPETSENSALFKKAYAAKQRRLAQDLQSAKANVSDEDW